MRACDGAVYVQSSRVLGVTDTHDEGMADRVDSFLRDDTAMIPVGKRGWQGGRNTHEGLVENTLASH